MAMLKSEEELFQKYINDQTHKSYMSECFFIYNLI